MKNTKQIARTINNVIFAPIVLIAIIFLNSFFFGTIVSNIITIVSLAALLALGYIELLIQKRPFAGQPLWFTRSTKGQWLIIPKTAQGWLYAASIIAIVAVPLITTYTYFPYATPIKGFIIRLSIVLLLLIDIYRISHNVTHSVVKKNGKKK
jgi:hypothetical protein